MLSSPSMHMFFVTHANSRYVVHAWSADFFEMVEQLVEHLAPEPLPGQPAPPADRKRRVSYMGCRCPSVCYLFDVPSCYISWDVQCHMGICCHVQNVRHIHVQNEQNTM